MTKMSCIVMKMLASGRLCLWARRLLRRRLPTRQQRQTQQLKLSASKQSWRLQTTPLRSRFGSGSGARRAAGGVGAAAVADVHSTLLMLSAMPALLTTAMAPATLRSSNLMEVPVVGVAGGIGKAEGAATGSVARALIMLTLAAMFKVEKLLLQQIVHARSKEVAVTVVVGARGTIRRSR